MQGKLNRDRLTEDCNILRRQYRFILSAFAPFADFSSTDINSDATIKELLRAKLLNKYSLLIRYLF